MYFIWELWPTLLYKYVDSVTIQWGHEGTEQSPNPQMLLDQGDPNISQKEGSSGKLLLGIRPYPRVPQCPGPGWQLHPHFLPLCKSWEALMPSGPDSSLGEREGVQSSLKWPG